MQLYRANRKLAVYKALTTCKTLAEVSNTTGVSPRTLYNWLREDEDLKLYYNTLTKKGNMEQENVYKTETKPDGRKEELTTMASEGWNADECANMPEGIVYFISDGDAVKIGKTNGSPKKRLKSLQVGNPRKLELLMLAYANDKEAYEVESLFHKRYAHLNERGEWFNLTVLTAVATDSVRKVGYRTWELRLWESIYKPTDIKLLVGDYGEKCLVNKMDYAFYRRTQKIHEQYVASIEKQYAELCKKGDITK